MYFSSGLFASDKACFYCNYNLFSRQRIIIGYFNRLYQSSDHVIWRDHSKAFYFNVCVWLLPYQAAPLCVIWIPTGSSQVGWRAQRQLEIQETQRPTTDP